VSPPAQMVKLWWDVLAEINPFSASNSSTSASDLVQQRNIIMPAIKRKLLESQLQRRVRARRSSSEQSDNVPNDTASPEPNYTEAKNAPREDTENISESSDEDVAVLLQKSYPNFEF